MSTVTIHYIANKIGISQATVRNNVHFLEDNMEAMIEHLRKKSEIKK